MASFEQHCLDCVHFLGERCEETNRWMDELFKVYGPQHRRFRHHWGGIHEAHRLFGHRGRSAAIIHILRDCRNIPRVLDYDSGAVDALGLLRHWPATAYIHYTEEDFEKLVANELVGNSGRVLLAFIGPENTNQFLRAASRLIPVEVERLVDERWPVAQSVRSTLPPLQPATLPNTQFSERVTAYLSQLAVDKNVAIQLGRAEFAYVKITDLVNPLILVEEDYLGALKAELQGTDDLSVARFALPEKIQTEMKGVIDPTGRSVTFVSSEKTLSAEPATISHTESGVAQVTFGIGTNAAPLVVSVVNDRLFLRNGIHRAFLLAQLGYTEVPAIVVREAAIPAFFSLAYPAFTPTVLALSRPPLLTDMLDERLTVKVPLLRTRKVVRITVDDLLLPID